MTPNFHFGRADLQCVGTKEAGEAFEAIGHKPKDMSKDDWDEMDKLARSTNMLTLSGVFFMHSFGMCTYSSMGFQIINLFISYGQTLVGPTSCTYQELNAFSIFLLC